MARTALIVCACLGAMESAPARAGDPAATLPERGAIVVLGDSLAAGYGLDSDEAFPGLLQKKIDSEGFSFKVVNAGVSGETSAGGLRRINWVLKQKVDVLILELGGNDGLRGFPLGETKANLQGIIDRARQKYPGVKVVVAGMQMPPNLGDKYGAAFQKIFPDLAATNRAALIPFLLAGVGGRAELNQADRIHPTAEGHRIVAENVWRILKPLLEKMQAGRS
jgi:acyl-CoA thioesterase-1